MAATPVVLSDMNDLAKDFYTDVYRPQENVSTPLKAQLERLGQFTYAGRSAIFGIKTRVGGGAANVGANKSLPDANKGAFDQGTATIVRTYARMAVDLFAAEVTKMQKGSYRPYVAELMEDRRQAIDKEINRQMFSKGDGKLATTPTGATSTTQTLSQDYNVTNGGLGVRHVVAGDYLAFYNTGPTLISRVQVTAVDKAASTVTVSSLTSVTNGFVSKGTSATDHYVDGEALGLLSPFISSGTFESITVGTGWLTKIISNSGTLRDISDSLVMQTVGAVHAESGEWPNLAVCRPGVVLKYSEVFLPIRRINGQDIKLKGGYKPMGVVQSGGPDIPILEDLDCPNSRVFFLNTKDIKFIDLVGTNWADKDGAEFRQVDDKDAVEAYMRKYWGVAWLRLNSQGVLEDVNDLTSIDRLST